MGWVSINAGLLATAGVGCQRRTLSKTNDYSGSMSCHDLRKGTPGRMAGCSAIKVTKQS